MHQASFGLQLIASHPQKLLVSLYIQVDLAKRPSFNDHSSLNWKLVPDSAWFQSVYWWSGKKQQSYSRLFPTTSCLSIPSSEVLKFHQLEGVPHENKHSNPWYAILQQKLFLLLRRNSGQVSVSQWIWARRIQQLNFLFHEMISIQGTYSWTLVFWNKQH